MLGAYAEHILKQLVAVFTLILNIMDCENGFDVFKAHSVCVIAAIIKRGERRLPIVAVNDIGLPINCRDYFKYRSCKKCKSFGVVIMAINTVALKIILVIKEVENNAVQLCLKNSAVLAAPTYGNGN